MKQNWQIKKLGELCDFIGDGDWIESKDQSTKGIRLIQTGNIGNGIYLDKAHHAHFISEETFSRLRCTEIFPGDCLISRLPDPVGRACIIPKAAEKMITAVDCTIIRFNKQIVPEYFVLYAQSNKYFIDIDSESTGATRKRISRKNLEKISVPLPPLEEQKRIVAVLDKKFTQIETLKTAAEKNLQNTKQLFQAELEKAFSNTSWEKKRLEDICDKIVDGTHNSPTNTRTGDYQYITAKNIKPTGIDLSDITYVTKEIHQSIYSRCNPEKGDVLLIKDGATTGIAVVNELEYEFSLLSSVALLKPNKKILNSYCLAYLLNSDQTYKQFRAKMEGAAITRLTLVKIKNFEIPLPPLEEQKRIVAYLDSLSEKVHQLEELYTKQLTDCDELKQSLLQKAFEGEL